MVRGDEGETQDRVERLGRWHLREELSHRGHCGGLSEVVRKTVQQAQGRMDRRRGDELRQALRHVVQDNRPETGTAL